MSRFRDAFASKALAANVTPIDLTALKLTTVTIEPSFQFKPLALAVNPGASAPSAVVEASAAQGSASASISAFASGSGSSSVSASAFAYVGPDGSSTASASASVSSGGVDRFVFKTASFPTVDRSKPTRSRYSRSRRPPWSCRSRPSTLVAAFRRP